MKLIKIKQTELMHNHQVYLDGAWYKTWLGALIVRGYIESKRPASDYENDRHFINWFWIAKDGVLGVAHLDRFDNIVEFRPVKNYRPYPIQEKVVFVAPSDTLLGEETFLVRNGEISSPLIYGGQVQFDMPTVTRSLLDKLEEPFPAPNIDSIKLEDFSWEGRLLMRNYVLSGGKNPHVARAVSNLWKPLIEVTDETWSVIETKILGFF